MRPFGSKMPALLLLVPHFPHPQSSPAASLAAYGTAYSTCDHGHVFQEAGLVHMLWATQGTFSGS